MRLQLIALGLVACSASRKDIGYGAVDLRSAVYTDTDATTVSTSVVRAQARASESVSITARRLVDFTSSASVDVVSAATGRWTEFRNETAGGIAFADGTTTASGDYVYSQENDWWSHNVALGGSRDFFQHNLTLGAGGSYVANDIGRADDEVFEQSSEIVGGSLSAVVVGTPKDVWKLSYVLSHADGYQASPYRLVRFSDDGLPAEASIGQPETLPDLRNRHSLTLRYNRWLWDEASLQSHARGYVDDWGILSLTGGTEWTVVFGPVDVGLNARGYVQRHAAFYGDGYPVRQRYMTSDRELSSFWDVFAGGSVGFGSELDGAIRQLRGELRLTAFTFRFQDFSRLPNRDGIVAEAGLGASF